MEDSVQAQLAKYKVTQQEVEEELQALEAGVKTEKTSYIMRIGWLEFLKDWNLKHLAHRVCAPDHSDDNIQLAAELTEWLVREA